jgi:large subunit ribosomal protein L23
MALFGKQEKTPKTPAKKKVPAKKAKAVKAVETDATVAYQVLVKPRVTEKTHMALGLNKYVFQVVASATKGSVKRAVEGAYGVKVEAVNIVNIPPKRRFFGRSVGMKSGVKKAVVTLREGDSIELFQGA